VLANANVRDGTSSDVQTLTAVMEAKCRKRMRDSHTLKRLKAYIDRTAKAAQVSAAHQRHPLDATFSLRYTNGKLAVMAGATNSQSTPCHPQRHTVTNSQASAHIDLQGQLSRLQPDVHHPHLTTLLTAANVSSEGANPSLAGRLGRVCQAKSNLATGRLKHTPYQKKSKSPA
jgi:hypothetical protein